MRVWRITDFCQHGPLPRPHHPFAIGVNVVVAQKVQNAVDKQMCDLVVGVVPAFLRMLLCHLHGDHYFTQPLCFVRMYEVSALAQRERQDVCRMVFSCVLAVQRPYFIVVRNDDPQLTFADALHLESDSRDSHKPVRCYLLTKARVDRHEYIVFGAHALSLAAGG